MANLAQLQRNSGTPGPSAGLLRVPLAVLLLAAACCGKQVQVEPSAAPPAAQSAVSPAPSVLLAQPHVTLVVVTDWQATLKPCGCTVDLQRGGIERIHRWVAQARQRDPSLLVVHAGSLLTDAESLSSPPKQAQLLLRRQTFLQGLDALGVSAAALSGWDLAQGDPAVQAAYAGAKFPLVSLGYDGPLGNVRPSVQLTSASGVQVALIGVDAAWLGEDPQARAAKVAAECSAARRKGAAVVVALSNLGLRQSRKLARAVADLDVVVAGQLDDKTEPVLDLDREGNTAIVQATRHGAWFAAVTLVPRDGKGPWTEASEYLPAIAGELRGRRDALAKRLADAKARGDVSLQQAAPMYAQLLRDLEARAAKAEAAARSPLPAGRLMAFQAVGLDWSYAVDPAMAALVQQYDQQAAESASRLANAPLPAEPGRPTYIGQVACLGCHSEALPFAEQNRHAGAWKTLERDGKTWDLDCVPCHVTGWARPGGSAFGNLSTFQAVQCEACHGPGSAHVAAQDSKGPPFAMPAVTADTCAVCHTAQHSPRFDFGAYRLHMLVPGHGKSPSAKVKAP